MLIKINCNLGSFNGLLVQTHSVKIEEKISCLNIKFNTTDNAWLQFMLWDPLGRLRMQHLHLDKQSSIIISEKLNENGCTVAGGDLPIGEYTLEMFVDIRNNIEYEIIIENKSSANVDNGFELWTDGNYLSREIFLNKYDYTKKLSEESRWYSGDCHTHSIISDGKQTVKGSMASAEKIGLDFYFITEHNILPTAWAKGSVLAIPGIEITWETGHFNALGLNKWIDFRLNSIDGGLSTEAGMNRLLHDATNNGSICSINHPSLYPYSWQYNDTLIKNIDTIEIINDPTFLDNKLATEKALILWNILWQDGHKVWGIGASDSHILPEEKHQGSNSPSLIGDPKTWVYSNGLSPEGIIDSIKQGRVYVSRGPEMHMSINCEGEEYLPGSDLSEHFNRNKKMLLQYSIKIDGMEEECELRFIENNVEVICRKIINGENYNFQFLWSGEDYIWNRIELKNKKGDLLLFTNPIFKGKGEKILKNWGELLKKTKVYKC